VSQSEKVTETVDKERKQARDGLGKRKQPVQKPWGLSEQVQKARIQGGAGTSSDLRVLGRGSRGHSDNCVCPKGIGATEECHMGFEQIPLPLYTEQTKAGPRQSRRLRTNMVAGRGTDSWGRRGGGERSGDSGSVREASQP
jgi:hypothetical protein